MSEKPITIVISDLHLGGGKTDKGDDHVYQDNQLCRFLNAIPEASEGKVELFINGDFLEFAQVEPEIFKPVSSGLWCSQQESKDKLAAIIRGHQDIFDELKEFQARGNQVTIAPGNHDVDMYWEGVRDELKRVIHEDVKFELGQDLYSRYDNRLVIGHGHAYDPANSFKRWQDPINKQEQRLEMCPGTLFMVKFVNWLEQDYPFSDNIKPVTALGRILWNENREDFKNAAKILFQIIYQNPMVALGIEKSGTKGISRSLLNELKANPMFGERLLELYRKACDPGATLQQLEKDLSTEESVTEFLRALLLKVDPSEWLSTFDGIGSGVLGRDSPEHLSVLRSGMTNEKKQLAKEAGSLFEVGAYEVVVFGHTHQPDEWRGSPDWDGGYFNPGSWTRYVDLDKAPNLTLEDLMREDDFPYQLNYIRIEQSHSGSLRADKICFEEANGDRFTATPSPEKYLTRNPE
jgi:UDP-2,3-diacylglucosamine pyrophosphatase LpxH